MYKRKADGWLKHWDFILIDLVVIQVSYVLAYGLAGYGLNPYHSLLYKNMAIILEIIDLIVILLFSTFRDVLRKGYYLGFLSSLKQGVLIGISAIIYLFLIQEGQNFSRLTIILTSLVYILLSYVCKEVWKAHLKRQVLVNKNKESLLVVTSSKDIKNTIEHVKKQTEENYLITGLVVLEDNIKGNIEGIPVVCNTKEAPNYVCKEWVDEIFILLKDEQAYPKKLIKEFEETGVTVHINIPYIVNTKGKKQFVESIGDYTVLTTAFNYATPKELAMKRIMDVVFGTIGCILTGILFVFIAPMIYISSPGPVFYSQERIGKNGKSFRMYKFRSMYLDADERKQELMKENKMENNLMFKLDFDPRIIGNKILPDGTRKTGIGNFIRKTSLDEFPQFFNVLKGDMSVVGTRPPLIEEVNQYELHHHARLAVKPGITGMWQVSGRSNITDFEEVVKLDKEYIDNWSIGLDIKIILKTILVVFEKKGSM